MNHRHQKPRTPLISLITLHYSKFFGQYRTIINGVWLSLLAVLWVFPSTILCQDSLLFIGTVRDTETDIPIRGARVLFLKSGIKASTNAQGIFKILVPRGGETIQISKVGYKEFKASLELKISDVVDFLLESVNYDAPEFVVESDPDEPVIQLMKKVLARKATQRDSIRTYTYTLYSKFIASADTITANRSSGHGDTTVVFLFESYSKGYYEKPDRYFNEIIQRRQTANVPPRANFLAFGTNINAYDDEITLFDQEISTPFHPNAISYYHFTPKDTLNASISPHAIRIEIRPKTNFRPLMQGTITIDTLRFIPLRVSLEPSGSVRLPFEAKVLYEQEFSLFEKRFLMPTGLHIEGSAEASFLWVINPRIDVSISTIAYDYGFNSTLDGRLFSQRRVEAAPEADRLDSAYWNPPLLPLTRIEEDAYRSIEMLIDNPDSAIGTNIAAQFINVINRYLGAFNRYPFSGVEDLFRYNRIHGAYFGSGVRIPLLQDRILLEGKGGYGAADQKLYWEAGGTYSSDQSRFFTASFKVYDGLLRRDMDYTVSTPINTISSFLFSSDYGDFYYARGYTLKASLGLGPLIPINRFEVQPIRQLSLTLRDESHLPAAVQTDFSLFGGGQGFRDNPAAQAGTFRSLTAELLWNYNPYRRASNFGLYLKGEISNPDVLPSDFRFQQYYAALLWRTPTLPLWRLDLRVQGGYSQGDIPVQRFFSLEAALNGVGNTGLFRAMSVKEFYGDRFLMATFEHNFGEVIPGLLRIPNLASFGLEFILHGGTGWTAFSNRTLRFTSTDLPTTVNTDDRWYYELGFGISRILLFLRVDISARFSQRDFPQFVFVLSTLGL